MKRRPHPILLVVLSMSLLCLGAAAQQLVTAERSEGSLDLMARTMPIQVLPIFSIVPAMGGTSSGTLPDEPSQVLSHHSGLNRASLFNEASQQGHFLVVTKGLAELGGTTETHWWDMRIRPAPPAQLEPAIIRAFGPDTGLFDVRWQLGTRRSPIPTFEIGGCDLVSGDEVKVLHERSRTAKFAKHLSFPRRVRQAIQAEVSFVVHTGCE